MIDLAPNINSSWNPALDDKNIDINDQFVKQLRSSGDHEPLPFHELTIPSRTQVSSMNASTVTLDDDPLIGNLLCEIIGIPNQCFYTSQDLLAHCQNLEPVGVFIDVYLATDENGLDIIPTLRKYWANTPIIVMSSDRSDELVEKALTIGASDFISKPLRPAVVRSRLLLRHKEMMSRADQTMLQFGDIAIDTEHYTLKGPKGTRFLSRKEIEILKCLWTSHGAIVGKNALRCAVWGQISVSANALDRKIFEVRKAVREVSQLVDLRTKYGQGVALTHT